MNTTANKSSALFKPQAKIPAVLTRKGLQPDSRDLAQRARVLAGLAQCLTRLAAQRRLAVVLMNQFTTQVSDNDTSRLIPALGDSWAHSAATQILLSFQDGTRQARIYKPQACLSKQQNT
ncbi:hypothetical protein WJX74_002984 [Apatococcus lobatus]|uniref:Rad51-like C-terminal domain-containing protein n=1 Tax=Apatococcus lobatus TaxID=904363 RepID=A0AAW1QK69_9CHLO